MNQVVWPTRRLLENIQAAVGGDPDWSPDAVYNTLRVRERVCVWLVGGGQTGGPREGEGEMTD